MKNLGMFFNTLFTDSVTMVLYFFHSRKSTLCYHSALLLYKRRQLSTTMVTRMAGYLGNPKGTNQREQSWKIFIFMHGPTRTFFFNQLTKLKYIHLGTVPSIVINMRAIGFDTDVYGPTYYVSQAGQRYFNWAMLF